MILQLLKEIINIIIIYVTSMMIEDGDVDTEHYRNWSQKLVGKVIRVFNVSRLENFTSFATFV